METKSQGVRNEDDQYIELCTDLGYNTCGTEMHMNSTHVSYLNRLFTTNREEDTIEKVEILDFRIRKVEIFSDFYIN